MSSWTKEDALKHLHSVIAGINQVNAAGRWSSVHTRWLANTLTFLEEVYGRESSYFLTIKSFKWHEAGSFVIEGLDALDIQGAVDRRHDQAFRRDLESSKGILEAAYDHLERTDLQTVYKGKNTGPESSAIIRVINLIDHKLRKVIRA